MKTDDEKLFNTAFVEHISPQNNQSNSVGKISRQIWIQAEGFIPV